MNRDVMNPVLAARPDREALLPGLFRSFWLAGFESACHINRAGARLDMVALTAHDRHVGEDFARLREMGIQVAREGIRWHLVDRAGRFDLSSVRPVLEAAGEYDIQVLWTLCHYGAPDGVDHFSPRFVDRFARYAGTIARLVRESSDETPIYAPINEVSFLSWAAGHIGHFYPYGIGRGTELKRNLVRAIIAGMEAIWLVDPRARFIHSDPLIQVFPPPDRPDLARTAADETAAQYEAWDMIAGGLHPDLGGHPKYLDIVGANYYHSNQWEFPETRIPWDEGPADGRRVSLAGLLRQLYHRYHRPLFVSETSHVGAGRSRWIREIAHEVRDARRQGVPVEGICLYPIIDRPDWDETHRWHHSGLWDMHLNPEGKLERRLCTEYAAELRNMQELLRQEGCR